MLCYNNLFMYNDFEIVGGVQIHFLLVIFSHIIILFVVKILDFLLIRISFKIHILAAFALSKSELTDDTAIFEYIGKLNFYCSAIDDTLCREGDNKTIGLLLCKTKDRIKAEYALRDIQKPIGVSDYELGQALPKDFRSSLPSIEEIEKGLNEWNQE